MAGSTWESVLDFVDNAHLYSHDGNVLKLSHVTQNFSLPTLIRVLMLDRSLIPLLTYNWVRRYWL